MRESVRGVAAILAAGWRASPGRTTASFGILLLNYVSRPVAAVALKHVTDAIVRHDATAAAFAAAVLPLIALVTYTGGRIAQVVWVELADLHLIRLGEELGELSQGSRGLVHHERADYADRLELLRNESKELYRSVELSLNAISLAAQIGLTVVLLARLQPALILLLLFGVPPLLAM